MFSKSGRIAARSFSVAALGLFGAVSVVHAQAAAPTTTPKGVTLVEVVRELGNSQPQFLWLRPGDAAGHTLFSYSKDDARNARCVDQCAMDFPPLVAVRGARAFGDWTLIRRSDGRQQWVYQGKPLYTWSMEKNPGEVATNIGLLDTANVKLAESVAKPTELMPPDGWQVVRFAPEASVTRPDGIDVRMVYAYEAIALTDFRGLTLYAYSGDLKSDGQVCTAQGCTMTWLPVSAPALASKIGDFSVVSRADGTPQWAFKGRPLYLYSDDELPGDVLGAGVDPKWTVAVLTQNFRPPAAGVTRLEGYGDTFTANGMTLYGGYAFGKRWGGRNMRDTFKDAYHKGKRLGGAACDDADCLQSWKPFLADANAQSGGFWEPITREDGTKQWAYKGFAMYTFAGDRAPGHNRGQAVYDFAKPEGDAVHLQRVAFYEEIGKAVAGAGIYWNIAKP